MRNKLLPAYLCQFAHINFPINLEMRNLSIVVTLSSLILGCADMFGRAGAFYYERNAAGHLKVECARSPTDVKISGLGPVALETVSTNDSGSREGSGDKKGGNQNSIVIRNDGIPIQPEKFTTKDLGELRIKPESSTEEFLHKAMQLCHQLINGVWAGTLDERVQLR